MPIERITGGSDGTQYRLPTGHTFILPDWTGPATSVEPRARFQGALDVLGDLSDRTLSIKANANLSEIGRKREIEPVQQKAIEQVAFCWTQIDRFDAHIANREAALLAVPRIDPTHSVMAIEDREIRDWWRSQGLSERTKLLNQIDNEPGHERMMLALMRSPVPQLDHEVKFVRGVWDRTQRLANPTEAFAIDEGKASSEWARRGLSNVAGMARVLTGWSTDRTLQTLLRSGEDGVREGYRAFGFNDGQVANARRFIEAQAA